MVINSLQSTLENIIEKESSEVKNENDKCKYNFYNAIQMIKKSG